MGRVELTSELAQAADTYRSLAERRGLEFRLVVADGLPAAVVLDRMWLRQILGNLLSNALKFTERGSIELAARRSPGDPTAWEVIVADTGCGITPEQRGRLFQAFSQGDATNSRRFGGSGLGLHLARELARLMGGDVVLVATDAGVGSAFALRLPLSPERLSDVPPRG